MEGGSQNHSLHYHFLHYAETDPLMDHTQASNKCHTRLGSHQRSTDRRAIGKEGRYEEAHRSTAHRTHKNSKGEYRVSSCLRQASF